MAGAQAMFDESYEAPESQDPDDPNHYSFGRIGKHDVVLACLPSGDYGTVSATALAMQMLRSFPIKIGLMVGIGGGVPNKENDMRLGDVVISKPVDCFGGVVQWDRGKRTPEGRFLRTGSLDKPPTVLLNALSALETEIRSHRFKFNALLDDAFRRCPDIRDDFSRPAERDDLYKADYDRDHDRDSRNCKFCDRSQIISRSQRPAPKILYGTIASGNSVVKSAAERDKICKDLDGIMCFEMEAAGLMGRFPCLVVRGICDYSDSHKNDKWQNYAAITSAVVGRRILDIMPRREVEKTEAAQEKMSLDCRILRDNSPTLSQQAMSPHMLPSTYPSPHQSPPLPVSNSPGYGNPAELQRQLSFDQLPTPFLELAAQPGASPPQQAVSWSKQEADWRRAHSYDNQLSAPQGSSAYHRSLPGLEQPYQPYRVTSSGYQPSTQQIGATADRLLSKSERPPGYRTPVTYQRSLDNLLPTHTMHPPSHNRPGHSEAALMQSRGTDGNPRTPRPGMAQSGGRAGYGQPSNTSYPQQSRPSQFRPPHQLNANDTSPPIPLRTLPYGQSKPRETEVADTVGLPAMGKRKPLAAGAHNSNAWQPQGSKMKEQEHAIHSISAAPPPTKSQVEQSDATTPSKPHNLKIKPAVATSESPPKPPKGERPQPRPQNPEFSTEGANKLNETHSATPTNGKPAQKVDRPEKTIKPNNNHDPNNNHESNINHEPNKIHGPNNMNNSSDHDDSEHDAEDPSPNRAGDTESDPGEHPDDSSDDHDHVDSHVDQPEHDDTHGQEAWTHEGWNNAHEHAYDRDKYIPHHNESMRYDHSPSPIHEEYGDRETPRGRSASSSRSSSKEYEEEHEDGEEGEHCCGGSWWGCGGEESKSDDGDHDDSCCKCVVM